MARAMVVLTLACALSSAHSQQADGRGQISGRVVLPASGEKKNSPSVVVWLETLNASAAVAPPAPSRFTLVQKNRTFSPHLLVVPVGSVVAFPNEDPFFHNVFSLFNGKRFDLGLYEAGSSRDVHFSREGVSYIFCNIHPEMSAVIIVLSTQLFAIGDTSAHFSIGSIPSGDYEAHVWVEGVPQPDLDLISRRVTLHAGESLSLTFDASRFNHPSQGHLNKFGKPYDGSGRPPY